jgi:nitrite reductase/ring-hydroxylating ferredoxin subunit/uncharacterized membrane protein
MLIVYPFAFLTGAFGFGLAGRALRNRDLTMVSRYLIPTGVAAGIVSAVPGLVDYLGSVPPRSSGRQRAARHGLLNTAALALFSASALLDRRNSRRTLPLLLQGLGTTALSIAGHLGGTLVYRNQIGVDHRYAGAGRWQEERLSRTDGGELQRSAEPLGVNQMKLVHVDGERVVVARTEDGHAAFDDRCTHKGGPLSDGALICGIVQCPWHGSQFDVRTGAVRCGPAEQRLRTFPVAEASTPNSR